MGLHGAPPSFSRLTALVFCGLTNVITYIDDLLTHTVSHQEQLIVLQKCFEKMRQFNLKFNITKCIFGALQVAYLGYNISERGISPANDKVEAVQTFQAPTTMTEDQSFIGFCDYFCQMIQNFSHISGPLINSTKKDSGWKSGSLSPKALSSFNILKAALCSAPVIGFSKSGGKYILTIDAATTGLRAILANTRTKRIHR